MLKKTFSYIPEHIKLLIKLYVFNLFMFLVLRIAFYNINKNSSVSSVNLYEKFMSYRMGLEFDISIFSWSLILPVLLWSLAHITSTSKLYKIGFYIFLSLNLIEYFVVCTNIPYFKQFGTHLNRHAFLWSENPKFILGMIFGSIEYWAYLILFLLVAFINVKISIALFYKLEQEKETELKRKLSFKIIWLIIVSGLVTIGSRGRTSDRSGIHEGLAIVSENSFINQVAINPNFTLWKTLLYNKDRKDYVVPSNISESLKFTRDYLGIASPYEESITRHIEGSASNNNYNFVIVIMESMSVFKMGYYNGKHLTPNLDNIIKQSVFCQNFFSSGIHTFNGLFSTSSGYPSIYAEKSMKSYVKQAFDGLGTSLSKQGYETYFYTTHDPHFDNMEGFFKLNKFEHFISQYDFDFSQAESSLGVPDHLLFNKLIETTNNRKNDKPFLSVLMTASDHGPWRIPTDINYKPNGETPQENCTLYADWAIGQFIEQAKKQPWFDNTVFMFLGDHGLSMGHTYEMPLSYNHVPFVIYQPNLLKPDTITSPCYQPDVPATVLGIIGAPYTNNTFGIDILKEKHPYVVFSADDKIGCVDDKGFYYYKTLSNNQSYLRKYQNLDQTNYIHTLKNKADSMNTNMTKIYESAEFLIRKNYFLFE